VSPVGEFDFVSLTCLPRECLIELSGGDVRSRVAGEQPDSSSFRRVPWPGSCFLVEGRLEVAPG